MLQNLFAAGAARQPAALGLHIRLIKTISGPKVQEVLKMVEQDYPSVGTSLLPVFFPGVMRVKESEVPFWREAIRQRMAPNDYGFRVDALPPEVMQPIGTSEQATEGVVAEAKVKEL